MYSNTGIHLSPLRVTLLRILVLQLVPEVHVVTEWDQSQCPHVPHQASGAITGSTVVGGQGDREGVGGSGGQ